MGDITIKYVDHMGDDLRVVNTARTSFNRSSDKLEERDKKLIDYLARNKHYSPFEQVCLTVEIECPVYIAQHLTRHRTGKFNMVSRRYTSEDIKMYVPKYRTQHASSKQCSGEDVSDDLDYKYQVATQLIHKQAIDLYNRMIDDGIAKELARGILPQNLMTKMIMTMDLRNLTNLIKLRDHHHAQYEAQVVARGIKDICMKHFPVSLEALLKY